MQLQLTELRIAGFGGQGVILSAIIIGKAASIHQGAVRHHDAELRSGSSGRRLQCATPALGPAHPLSLRHTTRHHGCHVARGLHALRSGTERRRHSDTRTGPGTRYRPATPNEGLQLPGHSAGRRTRQAHGSEFGDGGILRSRDAPPRTRGYSQSGSRLCSHKLSRSESEGVRKRIRVRGNITRPYPTFAGLGTGDLLAGISQFEKPTKKWERKSKCQQATQRQARLSRVAPASRRLSRGRPARASVKSRSAIEVVFLTGRETLRPI